jgi:hypothetical protein
MTCASRGCRPRVSRPGRPSAPCDNYLSHGAGGDIADSKQVLIDDGYPVIAFAYPYGAHTAAIDDAVLRDFKLVRTTGAEWCLK